jgi:hypothetical protein
MPASQFFAGELQLRSFELFVIVNDGFLSHSTFAKKGGIGIFFIRFLYPSLSPASNKSNALGAGSGTKNGLKAAYMI